MFNNLEVSMAYTTQQHREFMREWRRKNPEKVAEINRARRRSRAAKNQLLIYKYGISLDQKEALLLKQGGRCAICRADEPGWKHPWPVDHCHRTNRVRSILCHSCNIVLGRVKENTETLKSMITYIELHGSDSDVQQV